MRTLLLLGALLMGCASLPPAPKTLEEIRTDAGYLDTAVKGARSGYDAAKRSSAALCMEFPALCDSLGKRLAEADAVISIAEKSLEAYRKGDAGLEQTMMDVKSAIKAANDLLSTIEETVKQGA